MHSDFRKRPRAFSEKQCTCSAAVISFLNCLLLGVVAGLSSARAQTFANALAYQHFDTYEMSDQLTHPAIVYFAEKWPDVSGYQYWMAATPYPFDDATVENPSIWASNDGATWVVPAGLTNPLAHKPEGPWHNDDPDLLFDGSQLVVYYNQSNETSNPGLRLTNIRRMTSADGVNWSAPPGDLVLTYNGTIASPTVVKEGALYYLWYLRSSDGCAAPGQILARRTSSDGLNFGSEDIGTLDGPGNVIPWHFEIVKTGGQYVMIYVAYPVGGACSSPMSLYLAASLDGLMWHPRSTPLLNPGQSGSWDDGTVYRSTFLADNGFMRVWYAGRDMTAHWHVGYAEGVASYLLGVPDTRVSEIALSSQPNPFIGATRIAFELPSACQVTVSIFDLLGRRVRSLANGYFPAGSQSLEWDQRDSNGDYLAAGLYLCKLVAGDRQAEQKLIALRKK